jgi:hypothetical protein
MDDLNIIGCIVLTLDLIFLSYTLWRFIQLRYLGPIQYRSASLAAYCTIVGGLVPFFTLINILAGGGLPCWIQLWANYVIVSLYPAGVCSMAIRLSGEYRMDQAAMMIIGRKRHSNYHSISLKEKRKTDVSGAMEHDMDSETNDTAGEYRLGYTNWLIEHRHLFSIRCIFYGLGIYFLFTVLTLCIVYAISDRYSFSSRDCYSDAYYSTTWEVMLGYTFTALLLFVLMPVLLYWLRIVDDPYSVRRDLMWMLVNMSTTFMLYLILQYVPSPIHYQLALFSPNLLTICLNVNHVIYVCMPLIRLHRERKAFQHQFSGDIILPEAGSSDNDSSGDESDQKSNMPTAGMSNDSPHQLPSTWNKSITSLQEFRYFLDDIKQSYAVS